MHTLLSDADTTPSQYGSAPSMHTSPAAASPAQPVHVPSASNPALQMCWTQVDVVSAQTPAAPEASWQGVTPAVVHSVRLPVHTPAVVSPKTSEH